jgi:hypothetical protein
LRKKKIRFRIVREVSQIAMISTDGVSKSRMLYGYCEGKMKKIPTIRTHLCYGLHFSGHKKGNWGGGGERRSVRMDEL